MDSGTQCQKEAVEITLYLNDTIPSLDGIYWSAPKDSADALASTSTTACHESFRARPHTIQRTSDVPLLHHKFTGMQ